jgi:hypothetical protein
VTCLQAGYEDLIQRALVEAARGHDFPIYQHDPRTGLRHTSTKLSRRPKTALARPDSTSSIEPRQQRRSGYLREIDRQVWVLELGFDVPVATWLFEAELRQEPPSILRDPTQGRLQQVDLLLDEVNYQVPVTQQPAKGSKVTMRFTAQFSPI